MAGTVSSSIRRQISGFLLRESDGSFTIDLTGSASGTRIPAGGFKDYKSLFSKLTQVIGGENEFRLNLRVGADQVFTASGDSLETALASVAAFDWKNSVKVATNADIPDLGNVATAALANFQGQGVDISATGSRILVKDQDGLTLHVDNGLYAVGADGTGSGGAGFHALTRTDDADGTDGNVSSRLVVTVEEGDEAGSTWGLSTPNPITVGSTALAFTTQAIFELLQDPSPQLGGQLDMNGFGILAGATPVLETEVGYLSGVGMNIQTQLDTQSGIDVGLQTQIDSLGGSTITEVKDDTTPQLGGDLDLNQFQSVLNRIPTADQTANGVSVNALAGEAIAFGEVVYKHPTTGARMKAKGNSTSTTPAIEMCATAAGVTSGIEGRFLKLGYIRDDTLFSGLTLGGSLFVDPATAGKVTDDTGVLTSGTVMQKVGYVEENTGIDASAVVFFSPSPDTFEITT